MGVRGFNHASVGVFALGGMSSCLYGSKLEAVFERAAFVSRHIDPVRMHVGSLVAASTIVLLQVGERSLAFVSSIGGKRRFERHFKFGGFMMSTRGEETPCEVIVVGSCNMDLMTYTPRLPSRGENS